MKGMWFWVENSVINLDVNGDIKWHSSVSCLNSCVFTCSHFFGIEIRQTLKTCTYTLNRMKSNANTQFTYAKEDVQPGTVWDLRILKLWNQQPLCLCVIDSLWLNHLLCIRCSLFCLLFFITNCCSQLVCGTLWKLPGLCDHKLMKRCCPHLAKGPHVNDKDSKVFCNIWEYITFSFPLWLNLQPFLCLSTLHS